MVRIWDIAGIRWRMRISIMRGVAERPYSLTLRSTATLDEFLRSMPQNSSKQPQSSTNSEIVLIVFSCIRPGIRTP
jgi:hypothetical protein